MEWRSLSRKGGWSPDGSGDLLISDVRRAGVVRRLGRYHPDMEAGEFGAATAAGGPRERRHRRVVRALALWAQCGAGTS